MLNDWLTHKRLWAFYFSNTNVSGAQKLVEQGWHSGPREVTGVSHLSLVAPGFLPPHILPRTANKRKKKHNKTHKTTLDWYPAKERFTWNDIHSACPCKMPMPIYRLQVAAPSASPIDEIPWSLSLLHWFLPAQPTWSSRGYPHHRFPPQ